MTAVDAVERDEPSRGRTTGRYVQFGSGPTGTATWENYDASPSVVLNRIPGVRMALRGPHANFDRNLRWGDVIRGLPVPAGSCRGVYSSHVLEHLSHCDAVTALAEVRRILRPDGIFRLVMPDLEFEARRYVEAVGRGDVGANERFLLGTALGQRTRSRSLRSVPAYLFGNSRHLWLWDFPSIERQLADLGFAHVRRAEFNDSADPAFLDVETPERFANCLAVEASISLPLRERPVPDRS